MRVVHTGEVYESVEDGEGGYVGIGGGGGRLILLRFLLAQLPASDVRLVVKEGMSKGDVK
jgi:hypothetical protein